MSNFNRSQNNTSSRCEDVAPFVEHFSIPHKVGEEGKISCQCAEVREDRPKPPVAPLKDPRLSPRAQGRRLLQDLFWAEHEEKRRIERLPDVAKGR